VSPRVRPDLDGRTAEPSAFTDGTPIDDLGNPLAVLDGCPNCGDGRGLMLDGMTFFGLKNSGYDPDGYCSRACQLQDEYAQTLRGAA
jgi:hypothetical protein